MRLAHLQGRIVHVLRCSQLQSVVRLHNVYVSCTSHAMLHTNAAGFCTAAAYRALVCPSCTNNQVASDVLSGNVTTFIRALPGRSYTFR